MKKTIYRKIVATANQPKTWRIEGSRFPYLATIKWSRSTPGSTLTLFTGSAFNPKIELGSYDKDNKEYTIDLSKGDIIFQFPSEIVLQTTGRASVLVALDAEFPATRKRPSAVPEAAEVVVTELPVIPVLGVED